MADEKPAPFGPVIPCACGCKKTLHQFDATGRERKFIWGHGTREHWKRYRELLAKGAR